MFCGHKLSQILRKFEASEKPQVNPILLAEILAIPHAVVKKAIQEERNKKKIEESDIDRLKNIYIIHGAAEISVNPEENKAVNNGFVW